MLNLRKIDQGDLKVFEFIFGELRYFLLNGKVNVVYPDEFSSECFKWILGSTSEIFGTLVIKVKMAFNIDIVESIV